MADTDAVMIPVVDVLRRVPRVIAKKNEKSSCS